MNVVSFLNDVVQSNNANIGVLGINKSKCLHAFSLYFRILLNDRSNPTLSSY